MIERRTHTEVTSFPFLASDGRTLIVYPRMGIVHHGTPSIYEIGRTFSRIHSALGVIPQMEIRFVVSFDSDPVTVQPIAPICHTASFTHWPYETQNQVFQMFFFMGLAPLSWAPPVTHAHRRTSPIASVSLKITYAYSREPSRRLQLPPCVSRRPLPYFCQFTSTRDLVPRRQWTLRIQKAIVSPRDFNTTTTLQSHSRSQPPLLKLDSSPQCPLSLAPRSSPKSAMVVPLTRSPTPSMKVGAPRWQPDILDRGPRRLTTIYILQ
jgi:hypothetical protein